MVDSARTTSAKNAGRIPRQAADLLDSVISTKALRGLCPATVLPHCKPSDGVCIPCQAADLLDSVQEARNGYVAGVYTAEQMVDRIDNAFRGEENPL